MQIESNSGHLFIQCFNRKISLSTEGIIAKVYDNCHPFMKKLYSYALKHARINLNMTI